MAEDASTTSNANRVPPFDESRIQWKEATSANGRKYHIGTLKPDDLEVVDGKEEDLLAPLKLQVGTSSLVGEKATITHNLSDLYWPVGDSSWKIPAARIKDSVDIKRYCVTKNTGGFFDYIVYIDITQKWNYTFTDESPDTYFLSTFRTGSHYVTYDSAKPTIVKIKATS